MDMEMDPGGTWRKAPNCPCPHPPSEGRCTQVGWDPCKGRAVIHPPPPRPARFLAHGRGGPKPSAHPCQPTTPHSPLTGTQQRARRCTSPRNSRGQQQVEGGHGHVPRRAGLSR